MSLLWMDGFENNSTLSRKYSLGYPAASYTVMTSRPNSGSCVRLSGGSREVTWSLAPGDEHATLIAGVAFQNTDATWGSDTNAIISFLSDGGATWHVGTGPSVGGSSSTTKLRAMRGEFGTIIGTQASLVMPAQAWYYVEMKATLGDAGSVTVRVNGQTVIDASGVDTKNGGTKTVFDAVRLNYCNNFTLIDDFYICNGAGSAYNDFLGDTRVETLRPNGNGNYSDWIGSDADSTNNYQLVDEATYDAADYVLSSATNERDTYTFDDMVHTTGAVKGVMTHGIMSKTDTGARQARLIARTNSLNFSGPTEDLETTDYGFHKVWEKNPDTTNDWAIAEVNAAEFGAEGL